MANLKAISYAFFDDWSNLYDHSRLRDLRIEWRGAGAWVVTDGGLVLNSSNDWEYEPQPSSRTVEFLQRTRFSFEEARMMATKIATEIINAGLHKGSEQEPGETSVRTGQSDNE